MEIGMDNDCHDFQPGDGYAKCNPTGGVEPPNALKGASDNITFLLQKGVAVPSASAVHIDTSQSNVNLPGTGSITITLSGSGASRVIAAKSFVWNRSGNTMSFSNPTLVDSWINANVQNADSVSFAMAPFNISLHNGDNVVALEVYSNGNLVAADEDHMFHCRTDQPTNQLPTPCGL